MDTKCLFFTTMIVLSLLAAGCATNAPVTSTTAPTEIPRTTLPVTESSTHPWTCIGIGNSYSASDPRTPIFYEQANPGIPRYQSLPEPEPTPAYTGGTLQADPVIGTYVFEPGQFRPAVVERLEYFSTVSSPEFYYQVPLDISPDIRWTFRDDGVLLFSQNTINSSENSLRRFWRNSSGYYLRSGTWKTLESGRDQTTYQVSWGCSAQTTHTYVVTLDKNGVRLTQPNVFTMIKTGSEK